MRRMALLFLGFLLLFLVEDGCHGRGKSVKLIIYCHFSWVMAAWYESNWLSNLID